MKSLKFGIAILTLGFFAQTGSIAFADAVVNPVDLTHTARHNSGAKYGPNTTINDGSGKTDETNTNTTTTTDVSRKGDKIITTKTTTTYETMDDSHNKVAANRTGTFPYEQEQQVPPSDSKGAIVLVLVAAAIFAAMIYSTRNKRRNTNV